MELDNIAILVGVGTYILVFAGFLVKKLIQWNFNMNRLRPQKQNSHLQLPPGHMGWPFIGNMIPFVRAYKSQHPDSFLNNFKRRYGETGIYKTNLFQKPSIIVSSPELCRKVLTDYENFRPGYPIPALVCGGKSIDYISKSGMRRFRRLTAGRINGNESLSTYIKSIEKIVISTLEDWTSSSRMNQPIHFLPEMNKIAFKVIMTIYFGSVSDDSVIASMQKHYTQFAHGLLSTPINIPGFTFHRAFKARKMLVKHIKAILAERRDKIRSNFEYSSRKKGLVDDLIKEIEEEQGGKVDDEHIVILLLVFLLAGNEAVGRAATWTTIYLHQHPQVLQKAKEEQEEIIKRRPPFQEGLTLNEIKEMKYLSKVIDETLRIRTNSFALFREATNDIELNGYLIPKGWKVLVWHSAVHMNPEIYTNPEEFLPSRWDDLKLKAAGNFQAFGLGSWTCPGADLAKVEISIFLHYLLLNYKFEQLHPGGPVNYLPSPEPEDKCLARITKLN